jgi:metal-responsive CopG/Arc/MetJ family transcriptional regulator
MAKVLIQVSLEYEAYEKLEDIAKKRKISKSELIRQAVDSYLVSK